LIAINHLHSNSSINSTKPHLNRANFKLISRKTTCAKASTVEDVDAAADEAADAEDAEEGEDSRASSQDSRPLTKNKECINLKETTKDKCHAKDRDRHQSCNSQIQSNTSRIGTIATLVAMMLKTGITVPPVPILSQIMSGTRPARILAMNAKRDNTRIVSDG
jgi:hypothetical protein